MRLSEIDENSNIIIEVNIYNQVLEFKSIVITKISNYILIEPIRIDNKVLNFESSSALIDIFLIRDEQSPIVWKRVALRSVVYNEKTYYKVIASGEGFSVNRRSAFRMYIGLEGIAQVGANRKPIDVIVKDISETGFSFVSKDDFDNSVKSTVRLVFVDGDEKFCLNGILMRQVEFDDSKFIYGCMLNIKNQLLNRYINQKQREMISKQRQAVIQSGKL